MTENVSPPSDRASSGGDGHYAEQPSPQEAVQRFARLIPELKEYAAYYLSARLDNAKLSVRKVVIYAVLGAVALLAGAAAVTTAVVLLLWGAALGLGRLFAGQLWLGCLVVALVVLLGGAIGFYVALRRYRQTSKQKTVQKYEQRQNWERGQYGRAVAQQAAASESH